MKQEKKSKRNFTQNIDVSKELERWIDYTIGELKNDYLIEIIIERKNEFIERIANSTPEEIKEIVQVTGAVINHLGGDTKVRVPKSGTHRVSIDFLYLLTAALSDDKRIRIPVPKDVLPPDILAICYRIIQTQAIVRYDLYIRKNPTVRNVFIARYLEIVEQDPIARPYGEKALEELSKPARGLFERKIKNIDIKERGEPDRGREFWQFVHEASLVPIRKTT